jgi:hypothetical protein
MPINPRGAQDAKRIARAKGQKITIKKRTINDTKKAKRAAFYKASHLERQKNNMLIQNNQEVNERR